MRHQRIKGNATLCAILWNSLTSLSGSFVNGYCTVESSEASNFFSFGINARLKVFCTYVMRMNVWNWCEENVLRGHLKTIVLQSKYHMYCILLEDF